MQPYVESAKSIHGKGRNGRKGKSGRAIVASQLLFCSFVFLSFFSVSLFPLRP
jgi:hypothetical protein